MKIHEVDKFIRDTKVTLISEYYDGQVADTTIEINGEYFITISGDDIQSFMADLEKLLSYKI